ncbi:MAG TPA: GTP-binding protein, partial [Gemmatales bacterium]|nr:GTP-binding protein [Gemmatales bacterium]
PRMAYVNKLDRIGADFYNAVKEMEEKLQANVALCAIPAGQGPANFEGIIDVIRMKMIAKDPADPKHWKLLITDIPEKYEQEAHEAREKLLNAVSLHDDGIAELLLEGKPIPEDQLIKAIRKATLAMKLNPVLCGSSFKYQGVQNLLDRVVDFMPCPTDRGDITAQIPGKKETVIRKALESEPMSALAF